MEPVRLYVVDDHPLFRQGLVDYLDSCAEFCVLGHTGDVPQALSEVPECAPDVLLMDVRLGSSDGIQIAERIRQSLPGLKVLVITAFDDESTLAEAAQASVDGFLLKTAPAEFVRSSVNAVYRGETVLSPDFAGAAFSLAARALGLNGGCSVTDDELEVLRFVAQGMEVGEIAQAMYVSERTVKRRLSSACEALAAKNRAQAIARAYELGLI